MIQLWRLFARRIVCRCVVEGGLKRTGVWSIIKIVRYCLTANVKKSQKTELKSISTDFRGLIRNIRLDIINN